MYALYWTTTVSFIVDLVFITSWGHLHQSSFYIDIHKKLAVYFAYMCANVSLEFWILDSHMTFAAQLTGSKTSWTIAIEMNRSYLSEGAVCMMTYWQNYNIIYNIYIIYSVFRYNKETHKHVLSSRQIKMQTVILQGIITDRQNST